MLSLRLSTRSSFKRGGPVHSIGRTGNLCFRAARDHPSIRIISNTTGP